MARLPSLDRDRALFQRDLDNHQKHQQQIFPFTHLASP
jgi:hypothetical protein